MMVNRKITIFGNLIRMLVAFVLLGSLMQASTSAAAAGCLGSPNAVYRAAQFRAYSWSVMYYDTTTANCRDFNVAVTNHNCSVWVDAQYRNSLGQWIDGAHDDVWIRAGSWYTPITNLRDNVRVRVRFFPACSDSLVYVWTAA